MNSYYYHQQPHHHVLLQQYYYVPISPVYDHVGYTMDMTFYPQSAVRYVDDVAILNATWVMNQQPVHSYTRNHYIPTLFNTPDSLAHPFETSLEESLIMQELEAADHHHHHPAALRQRVSSGSGLSEEEISEHLHVYTAAQGNSEDNCCICLGEYETNDEIGRLECGHRYHADCIRSWLLSNNVCPMCRSTALTV